MEWQGYLVIFGSLAAVVGAIVGGINLGGVWGTLLTVAGIIGAVAWLFFAFRILSAFNSDI